MNAAALRLVPLKCPNCGGELPACENDVLFACAPCGAAWELEGAALAKVPLVFVKPLRPAKARPDLHLPLWRFGVALQLSSADASHRHVLQNAMAMPCLYVSAFTIHGLHAFGDLGLACSQAQPALEEIPGAGLPLVGGDRGRPEARRWLPLTVLHMLSRRINISEVGMSLREGDSALLGVPFYDEGPRWRDGILGEAWPKQAVLDGPRIEDFWRRGATHPA